MKKFITIFAILVTQTSYAQFNKMLESAINNAATRINNQTSGSELKKDSQSTKPTNGSNNSNSTIEQICAGTTKSQFKEYLELINSLNAEETDNIDVKYKYDTSDRVVAKWIEDKLKNIAEDDRKNGRSYNQTINDWLKATNACAFRLFQTQPNSMKLFVSDKRNYKYISEKLKTAKDTFDQRNAKTRSLSDTGDLQSTNRQKSESGDPFEMPTRNYVDTSTYNTFFGGSDQSQISDASIVPLLIMLDPDGRVTTNIHAEIMRELRSKIDTKKAENAKWNAAVLAQKAEDEKKAKARKEYDKQMEAYYTSLKNGNYRAAKSCLDIIDATDSDDGLLASVKPHQKLKSGTGVLRLYKNDIVGEGGTGTILGKGYGAEIRANKSTVWINRDDVRVGVSVVVIGKYVDNTIIKLANGSGLQSPVLELVCIEPN